jgi:hypothetical protein
MQDAPSENSQRWLAWRLACERGQDRAEAYDLYLHPQSRLPVERIASELGSDPVASPVGLSA